MNIQFNHDGKNLLEFLNLVNDENEFAQVRENLSEKLSVISKRYVIKHEGDATKVLIDMQEALSDEEILFLALGVIKEKTMKAIEMSDEMSGNPAKLLNLLNEFKDKLSKLRKEDDEDTE